MLIAIWIFGFLSVCPNLLVIFKKYVAYYFVIVDLWVLYVLATPSLSAICFMNIFSESVDCLFISLSLSFCEQNILISSLIFQLKWIGLICPKETLATLGNLCMFPSRGFKVFSFYI